MEKLPSRHAITELMSWISLMENIIKEDEQKIMAAVGSELVQMYLQKYKVSLICLSSIANVFASSVCLLVYISPSRCPQNRVFGLTCPASS